VADGDVSMTFELDVAASTHTVLVVTGGAPGTAAEGPTATPGHPGRIGVTLTGQPGAAAEGSIGTLA
jgi:hypothetical protein